ncbi:MAG: DMT family transporter [Clostridia bacterium]|nr:DMT family transporter [Clostridia bacterium]
MAALRAGSGYAWAAVAALAFSFEGVLAKGAFRYADPFLVMAARFSLAALLAFLLPGARRASPARERALLFVTGALGYAGTTALLFLAFTRMATSLAILVLYAYPALVAIGAHALGRERLSPRQGLALVATFLGVAVVSGAGGRPTAAGMVASGLAAVLMAVTILVQQPVLSRLPAEAAARPTLVGAALAALAFTAASGRILVPPAPAWPYLVGLAAGPSVLAVFAMNRSIQEIGASRTAIVATLEPAFAALWGAVWLGERLGPAQLLGALLVLCGVAALEAGPAPPSGRRGEAGRKRLARPAGDPCVGGGGTGA